MLSSLVWFVSCRVDTLCEMRVTAFVARAIPSPVPADRAWNAWRMRAVSFPTIFRVVLRWFYMELMPFNQALLHDASHCILRIAHCISAMERGWLELLAAPGPWRRQKDGRENVGVGDAIAPADRRVRDRAGLKTDCHPSIFLRPYAPPLARIN